MRLAYLDAGSGSLIVQAVVAGAAGMAVAVKLYWRRLTGRFRRSSADSATETTAAEKD
jgi:L-serine deaminase